MPSKAVAKRAERDVAVVQRRAKALQLRGSGATYQQIADTVGYSDPSSARKAVMAAMKELTAEPAEELIAIENSRLDQMLLAVWPQAIRGNLYAIDRVLKIMARRARLLGLDAPTKKEISGEVVMQGFSERVAREYGLDAAEVMAEAQRILAGAVSEE